MPLSADDNFVGWDRVSQLEGGRDVCVEGFQISVINANDFCAPRQRQFQFCFGMGLRQGLLAPRPLRYFGKITQLCQCQDRNDEQNSVLPLRVALDRYDTDL